MEASTLPAATVDWDKLFVNACYFLGDDLLAVDCYEAAIEKVSAAIHTKFLIQLHSGSLVHRSQINFTSICKELCSSRIGILRKTAWKQFEFKCARMFSPQKIFLMQAAARCKCT